LNLQLWIENIRNFGSPLSPDVAPEYNPLITSYSPLTFLSNLVRLCNSNLLLVSSNFNEEITSGVLKILNALGIDPDDKGNTWSGGFNPVVGFHEDIAGSPSLVALIFIFLFITVRYLMGKIVLMKEEKLLLLIAVGVLFGTIYALRWQPWINRLILPAYVVTLISVIPLLRNIGRITAASRRFFFLFLSVSVAYSFLFTLFVTSRPLATFDSSKLSIFQVNKIDLRFINSPWLQTEYLSAIEYIEKNSIKKIFVDSSSNSWEYPLWYFIGEKRLDIQIHSILELPTYRKQPLSDSLIVCIDVCSIETDLIKKIEEINETERFLCFKSLFHGLYLPLFFFEKLTKSQVIRSISP
jgi:hypothetical protein